MTTAPGPVASILSGLSSFRGWQENLNRDLHQNAELSHQEQRTAGQVAQRLGEARRSDRRRRASGDLRHHLTADLARSRPGLTSSNPLRD
jgi:metal-dependent amidase/aminoacylase/carboxypeptidase family protein